MRYLYWKSVLREFCQLTFFLLLILLYGGLPAALLEVHWNLGTEGVPVKSWRARSGKKLVSTTGDDVSFCAHRFSLSAELCGVYENAPRPKVIGLWQSYSTAISITRLLRPARGCSRQPGLAASRARATDVSRTGSGRRRRVSVSVCAPARHADSLLRATGHPSRTVRHTLQWQGIRVLVHPNHGVDPHPPCAGCGSALGSASDVLCVGAARGASC